MTIECVPTDSCRLFDQLDSVLLDNYFVSPLCMLQLRLDLEFDARELGPAIEERLAVTIPGRREDALWLGPF